MLNENIYNAKATVKTQATNAHTGKEQTPFGFRRIKTL